MTEKTYLALNFILIEYFLEAAFTCRRFFDVTSLLSVTHTVTQHSVSHPLRAKSVSGCSSHWMIKCGEM